MPIHNVVSKQEKQIKLDSTDDPLGSVDDTIARGTTYQFDDIRVIDSNKNGKIDTDDQYEQVVEDEEGTHNEAIAASDGMEKLQGILQQKYHIAKPMGAKLEDMYEFARGVAQFNQTLEDIESYLADPNVNIEDYADTFSASLTKAVDDMSAGRDHLGKKRLGKEGAIFLASAEKFIKQEAPDKLKPAETEEIA